MVYSIFFPLDENTDDYEVGLYRVLPYWFGYHLKESSGSI